MADVLTGLLHRDDPVEVGTWRSFWDRLREGRLQRGEAAAVVASLSTQMPSQATLGALLTSLEDRRPQPPAGLPDTVNVVGTGGGPSTFNISTAAAFVAAAMGVRVVKTGSRAYTSRYGSLDLLDRLGVPLARSHQQTANLLERFGIAFAGHYVYPPELARLARELLPLDMRRVGRFFNSIGPFLAAVPRSAQVTGVSDHALLPTMRYLADRRTGCRIWLCTNRLGADELISGTENVIYPNDGSGELRLSSNVLGLVIRGRDAPPQRLPAPEPTVDALADLRPVADDSSLVAHFLGLLSGDGPPTATRTICLNAAAVAMLGGAADDWVAALRLATEVVERGRAVRLVERLRAYAERVAAADLPAEVSVGA
jgi:anthranilate phosphoribosyltransferase